MEAIIYWPGRFRKIQQYRTSFRPSQWDTGQVGVMNSETNTKVIFYKRRHIVAPKRLGMEPNGALEIVDANSIDSIQ